MNQSTTTPSLSPKAKSTIKIVFLTLFLDIVGFSIIFPLFPSLIEHYLKVDGQNFYLQFILRTLGQITQLGGVSGSVAPIVLFGGLLGALYSLLQFLFSPFWGSLSDRIGRRPVLLISMSGMTLSYLLWIFSGSFTLLLISRIIGGIMGGNISTATAAVGDVTSEKNRSKGMAFVGIAIGTGFIFGPALGGIFSLIEMHKIWPNALAYGLNPFSAAAALACLLSAINLFSLFKNFKETLPEDQRGQSTTNRTANPLNLFKPLPDRRVNLTNLSHFFFLASFSGMEFTLTFLAVERLGYTSLDNGLMFIFIGLTIAFIQGGFVRRKASQIGEKKLALLGMVLIAPGLFILGQTYSSGMLYLGLFFLAIGAALIIPCLTALVSLFADTQTQGKAIGTFRSMGALARVFGPFIASVLYWRYGATTAYSIGALALILPVLILTRVQQPKIAT